ncbi:MAG TPA: 3-oxo-tetronate kinase [Roseiarcus sp.]|nr:3-oxo-tetronate kinase [Roseiarcus sp.]
MLLGCIADDFTGASDLANTLAKGGMRTVQVIGAPGESETVDAEAAVIALKTRSIAAAQATAQSLAALEWLIRRGSRQFVFKICSTFDSTPAGNIGPVAEALAARLGARGVPVCPAFPAAGRTVYQGHLFVRDRLLNESGMEKHPLNPMTDPDIRRWLRRQATGEVGHVGLAVVRRGAAALRAALASADVTLAIVDAVDDHDLALIGEACREAPLLVGGSGIAKGLPTNFRRAGMLGAPARAFAGARGRGAILSGSCSPATREQVAVYAARAPALKIDIGALMEGRFDLDEIAAFARSTLDASPLIYSSAEPAEVARVQALYGDKNVAEKLEAAFGEIARLLVDLGCARLVVAGGETSGAVVSALGLRRLQVGPEIATGVPALTAEREPPLVLALKSGNFGAADFFSRALEKLGGGWDDGAK